MCGDNQLTFLSGNTFSSVVKIIKTIRNCLPPTPTTPTPTPPTTTP